MARTLAKAFLVATLLVGPLAAAPVRTGAGMVEGVTEAGGVVTYKGIPFAAPPTGPFRWRAPQRAVGWKGVRRADAFAPACPQDQGGNARLGLPLLPTSEDCLYLNIWSPPRKPGERLPVMVWIYGGGFIFGATSIPTYSGNALARHGVVVVSIAYRLGALGFLAHPDLTAESRGRGSGNYGMLDQIAGLRWVRDNIAAFGGDPANVTIFGESAGGVAVSILAASPPAKGLFQRVISESGGSFAPPRRSRGVQEGGLLILPQDFAEEKGRAFFRSLGVATLAEARARSADDIVRATGSVLSGQFWPVIDDYVLPGDQYRLYSQGRFNDVPILVGTNSDEGALFVPNQAAAAHHADEVRAAYGPFADEVLAAYPVGDGPTTLHSARDLRRDATFGWSTWTWARLQAEKGRAPSYLYYFDHRPPWPAGPQSDWGAAHASEIPYVFGTLDTKPEMKWTEADRQLSDRMMLYWVNFARTGDPNGSGLPAWPAFTAARPAAMYLTDDPHGGPVPNLARLQVFDRYFAWRREQDRAAEPKP